MQPKSANGLFNVSQGVMQLVSTKEIVLCLVKDKSEKFYAILRAELV